MPTSKELKPGEVMTPHESYEALYAEIERLRDLLRQAEARMTKTFEGRTQRNFRVKARYDELMREGKHGHYETMFRVVREEVELRFILQDEHSAEVRVVRLVEGNKRLLAEIDRLRAALTEVTRPHPDMDHVDFRMMARRVADAALEQNGDMK